MAPVTLRWSELLALVFIYKFSWKTHMVKIYFSLWFLPHLPHSRESFDPTPGQVLPNDLV